MTQPVEQAPTHEKKGSTMNRFHHHRRTSAILMTLSGLVFSLAVVGSFGIAETLAGDLKAYAGIHCLPVNGAGEVVHTGTTFTGTSTTAGRSLKVNSTRDIFCPVVRDVPTDDIDDVEVSILNDSVAGPDATRCCLIIFDFDSNASQFACGVPDQPNRDVITFEGPEVGDPFDYGYYTLKCTLEANEEIFGYVLDED
jgi:hypothetical protein